MALPKISEIRDLSDTELEEQIAAAKKQLFELRFQQATRQLEKTHQFKHTRHRLAQLLTLERERQRVADSASASSTEEE
jgi:large subunit ribosomal protein L29